MQIPSNIAAVALFEVLMVSEAGEVHDARGRPDVDGHFSPPARLSTERRPAAAWDLFGSRYPAFKSLSKVFSNTGIIKRHGVKPIEWYFEPRSWPERTAAFLEGAEALFIDATRDALRRADLDAADIDTVVTVCSTGIATPSLDARVAARLGFRPDISRVPIFGLGCAGGVSGLSVAAKLAQASPGSNVLLVAVELCTLAFRLDELSKANIVATSLFADGAAAVILRAGDGGATQVECSGEHLWPDTLDINGMECRPARLRRDFPARDSRLRHG